MAVCPVCGVQSFDEQRACTACGSRLYLPETAPGRVSRPVAIVAWSLVERPEEHGWDPGDVTRLRGRFTESCADAVRAHGGLAAGGGDVLLAAFGSAAPRGDDAERAVRAAFGLLDEARRLRWPDGKPAQASAAVEAGDVALRSRLRGVPDEDWSDSAVARTAAHLLAQAPPGAVWSAAGAYLLTREAVRYQSAHRFPGTGGDAVEAWRATGLSAAAGERRVTALPATTFVGRGRELDDLRATMDAAFAERLSRVAVVVGEGGVGKSRLLNELGARVTTAPDAAGGARGLRWLRGHCRPWPAFSALRDVVRADAGIDDHDDAAAREAKLAEAVRGQPDAPWILARLRPLAGLESRPAGREESFAAWRAYLGGLAAGARLALVFEDLERADEALLDFLDTLARDPLRGPVVVLAGARPELAERRPALADGSGVRRVSLSPLAPDQLRELAAALIGDELPEALDAAMGQEAATPLFAESYIRLLADRGVLLRGSGGVGLSEDPGPPAATADAVIAQRLDTLPHAQWALMRDAAVLRDDPWPEALEALSPRGGVALERLLQELAARRLIRAGGTSCRSSDGRPALWSGLVADAALGEMPAAERALLHRTAAAWLEREPAVSVPDRVEALARHWVETHSPAAAAEDWEPDQAALGPAERALEAAGRTALTFDPPTAAHRFRSGLALAGEQGAARASLLQGLGEALLASGERPEAVEALRRAVVEAAAGGHRRLAALAGAQLAGVLAASGDDGHEQVMGKAADLVRDDDDSPEKVEVLTACAAYQTDVLTERQAAADAADAAIATAQRLAISPPASALAVAGHARCLLGDPAGIALVERAADETAASGGAEWPAVERRYAACLHAARGPVAALRRGGEVLARAESRGAASATLDLRADRLAYLALLGEWDAVLDQAPRLVGELQDAGRRAAVTLIRAQQAVVLARRGRAEAAASLVARLLEEDGGPGPQHARSARLLAAVIVYGLAGDTGVADELATRWVRGWDGNDAGHAAALPDAVRLAPGCRDPRWLGEPLGAVLRDLHLYGMVIDTVDAVRAERAGRLAAALDAYGDVAGRWRAFGAPYEEGQAALGEARCLVGLERAPEAGPWLARAGDLFGALKAEVALREVRGLATAAAGPVPAPPELGG